MFDIAFTAMEPEPEDGDWLGLEGRVILGDHAESFLAPMWPWSRADYERQWRDGAARLLAGAESSAFFSSAFRFWWAAWRVGDELVLHEEFLTPERLAALGARPDVRRAPYQLLGPLNELLAHPRIAGHGPTLYESGLPNTRRLGLISAKPLRNGAVAMHYRRLRTQDRSCHLSTRCTRPGPALLGSPVSAGIGRYFAPASLPRSIPYFLSHAPDINRPSLRSSGQRSAPDRML